MINFWQISYLLWKILIGADIVFNVVSHLRKSNGLGWQIIIFGVFLCDWVEDFSLKIETWKQNFVVDEHVTLGTRARNALAVVDLIDGNKDLSQCLIEI
jgi:hypothetical protein